MLMMEVVGLSLTSAIKVLGEEWLSGLREFRETHNGSEKRTRTKEVCSSYPSPRRRQNSIVPLQARLYETSQRENRF